MARKTKPGPKTGAGGKKRKVSVALSPAALAKIEILKYHGESASSVIERVIMGAGKTNQPR